MAPAKYLVTVPPGAPIDGVGFVRPGEVFTAPEGCVPSRTFRAINEEAVTELKKLQADLLARAKELRGVEDRSKDERTEEERRLDRTNARRVEADAKSINLEIFEMPRDEKVIEEGITLSELAAASAGGERPTSDKPQQPPKGGRAADK